MREFEEQWPVAQYRSVCHGEGPSLKALIREDALRDVLRDALGDALGDVLQ